MNKIIIYLLLACSLSLKAQNSNSSDIILCELNNFLLTETNGLKDTSISNECEQLVHIREIISNKYNLNVDFGVFAFGSNLLSEGCIYYLVKNRNTYYIFSAKDPILVINKLLELQEQFPNEIDVNKIMKYIKTIGKTRACNMSNYMVVSKDIDRFKYIYAIGRYQ